jgi:peptidyl-prolyl cis-trans isomerase C
MNRILASSIFVKPLAVAAIISGLSGPVFAQEGGDTVIAKVGEVEITSRELALAEVDLMQQFAQTPAETRKAAILNALIDIKVLAEVAKKKGYADKPDFQTREAFNRSRTLHNNIFQKEVLDVITEEEVQARYDVEIKNYPQNPEVKARHILVKTEDEAKAIITELDGGADFIELAKEKSTGPSGPGGGDLGYFGKGQMVPEFEVAAFNLEKGAYTKEPVKSQFGWHIILKDDERMSQPPTLEQVGEQVKQAIARDKYFKLTQDARSDVKFEILDDDLKTAVEALK